MLKRIHIPDNVKHRYLIQSPNGRHRSFRIQKYEGSQFKESVKNESIQAINKMFKAGALTKSQAKQELQKAVLTLYRADGVKISRVESNTENMQLLDRYFKQEIKPRRTKDKASTYGYFKRGVEALGELSLLSSDIVDLQMRLDERYPNQRQRRLAVHLNVLLKWAGRTDVKFQLEESAPSDVRYIPFDKIDPILTRLPSDGFRVLCQMALYTGLRIGELMALEPHNLKRASGGIFVEWQIDKTENKIMPKWKKRRTAAVFQEALALYDQWINLKDTVSHKERLNASKTLKKACSLAYPNKPQWSLRFHDLRHSYAIKCFDQGMSLEWVAKQLGNRIEVTERHYIGFVQSNDTLEAAFQLMNKDRKLKTVS